MTRILWSLVGALLTISTLSGQSTAKFEVASIKRNTGGWVLGTGIGSEPGGRWVMTNMPVSSLIYSAYPTLTNELLDAPDWVRTEHWDVIAKASAAPTRSELTSMLQALLAERFAFRAHIESVERPVYQLVVARADGRLGPDIRRFEADCAAYSAAVQRGNTPAAVTIPSNGASPCGMLLGGNRILAGGIPIEMLARNISQAAGRVVIDRTKLSGVYEFTLRYAMGPGPETTGVDEAPSIFVALQEQLGLKLEPARAPVERIVVEHIERPTAD